MERDVQYENVGSQAEKKRHQLSTGYLEELLKIKNKTLKRKRKMVMYF